MIGWQFGPFGILAGVGRFGAPDKSFDEIRATIRTVPAIELRFGRSKPFSGMVGLGAPPVPGLARFYGLYTHFNLHLKSGPEIGFGSALYLQTDMTTRASFIVAPSLPVSDRLRLGGFAGIESAGERDHLLGYVLGASLTLALDDDPRAVSARIDPRPLSPAQR